jgi:hypothetical protein
MLSSLWVASTKPEADKYCWKEHLTLPLLVFWIFAADDHGDAVPLDHAAAVTDGLD